MTNKIKVLIYAAVAVAISVGMATSVNVHGNLVNADAGYQLAGAAPLNHFLCGNGTSYIDSSNCLGAGASHTCNSNGCYRISPDGTIYEWGTTQAFGGATSGSFTLSLPVAFTNLSSVLIVFSSPTCGSGNATACSASTGGSSSSSPNCAVMNSSLTAPTVAWWDQNTAPAGSSCLWIAVGY